MSHYIDIVADTLAAHGMDDDARHTLGWMYQEHNTLDGLSPVEFERAAIEAAFCVQGATSLLNEEIAKLAGL